jgi:hypothetical protein
MRIRLMTALLVFGWLLTPEVICLIPGLKTVSEHECCRRMGGDCGKVPVPDLHRCCRTIKPSVGVIASKMQDNAELRVATLPAVDAISRTIIELHREDSRFQSVVEVNPPPLLSAESIDILRI